MFSTTNVAVSAEGELVVRLGRAAAPAGRRLKAWPAELGIELDGVFYAVASPMPIDAGGGEITLALPRDRLCGELNLVSVPDRFPLLPRPIDLAPFTLLDPGRLAVRQGWVQGEFRAAAWLAPVLAVELVGDGYVFARALARRQGAVHRFRAELRALVLPNHALMLRPRIGGLWHADGPGVALTAQLMGYAGCIVHVGQLSVQGWAVDMADPTRPVSLELVLDGEIVRRFTPDQPRGDLARAGLGVGAFRVELPLANGTAAPRQIAVRLAGTRIDVSNSPVLQRSASSIVGSVDSVFGSTVFGWALDRDRPETPLTVEIVDEAGAVLGRAVAGEFRGDLLEAGLARGYCAFSFDLTPHYAAVLDHEISVRIAGNFYLPGSPRKVTANPNLQRFLARRHRLTAASLPRLKRRLNHRAGARGISVIMPVFNPRREWLIQAIDSVRAQFCDNWELICVDDGSSEPHVAPVLAAYARADARIRVLTSRETVGTARATNFGLRTVRHEHVAFMEQDDYLEPDAVWQLLRAILRRGADLFYSDEALTDDSLGRIVALRLRPAFSHDYYLSHRYFVHLVCVRADLAHKLGGYDEQLTICADFDFVLRALEHAALVAHVPAVLYRSRTHGATTEDARPGEVTAATACLQRHLDRLGTGARARGGVASNHYHIAWPEADGRILIVIPTKDRVDLLRVAIESIERTADGADYRLVVIDHQSEDPQTQAYLRKLARTHTVMRYAGPFNFSRMNNLAVEAYGAGARFVLFLNNDIEATEPGWLGRMSSLAVRPEVGAVGALLMYATKRVQHAGVILGFQGAADHVMKMQHVWDGDGGRNPGYNGTLTSTRDFSAVTAACMMMRREVFAAVGGFDESFGVGFNDTDLCLRVVAAGYRVLYDGATLLYHYESATRSQTGEIHHPEDTARLTERWATLLRDGDPYYNPNLSLVTQDHVPREDEGCRIVGEPRVGAGGEGRPGALPLDPVKGHAL